ncbi:MAG: CsgG/HfaB family protein [Treponema sp.]|nr:CsgG/HfaB family protein [Treponema sp.]
MKQMIISCAAIAVFTLFFSGCATESNRALVVEQTRASELFYSGPRSTIAVGNFDNRTSFQRGIFSDGVDRLGNQAKTILITHLSQTNRFTVLDRGNMEELLRESQLSGEEQDLIGASYIVSGDVSEFGRREVSNYAFFGILGRGRQQMAYSRVNLNIVDIRTSAVVFSVSGAGEYMLSDHEVLGFGSSAGYDSMLNGRVLDLAIREAVDRLAEAIDQGAWVPVPSSMAQK